jgi:hypothetical protein
VGEKGVFGGFIGWQYIGLNVAFWPFFMVFGRNESFDLFLGHFLLFCILKITPKISIKNSPKVLLIVIICQIITS